MEYTGSRVGPPTSEQAKRQLQIPSEIEQLNQEVGNLHKALEALGHRLTDVLQPRPASASTEKDAPDRGLAGQLRALRREIALATARVQGFIDELEL